MSKLQTHTAKTKIVNNMSKWGGKRHRAKPYYVNPSMQERVCLFLKLTIIADSRKAIKICGQHHRNLLKHKQERHWGTTQADFPWNWGPVQKRSCACHTNSTCGLLFQSKKTIKRTYNSCDDGVAYGCSKLLVESDRCQQRCWIVLENWKECWVKVSNLLIVPLFPTVSLANGMLPKVFFKEFMQNNLNDNVVACETSLLWGGP